MKKHCICARLNHNMLNDLPRDVWTVIAMMVTCYDMWRDGECADAVGSQTTALYAYVCGVRNASQLARATRTCRRAISSGGDFARTRASVWRTVALVDLQERMRVRVAASVAAHHQWTEYTTVVATLAGVARVRTSCDLHHVVFHFEARAADVDVQRRFWQRVAQKWRASFDIVATMSLPGSNRLYAIDVDDDAHVTIGRRRCEPDERCGGATDTDLEYDECNGWTAYDVTARKHCDMTRELLDCALSAVADAPDDARQSWLAIAACLTARIEKHTMR